MITRIDNNIQLFTRNQLDWTEKFLHIVKDIKKLGLSKTILDGELVYLDNHHQSQFQLLQNALQENSTDHLIYYIFDVLYYQGKDVRAMPLIERKALLETIFKNISPKLSVRFCEYIIGEGAHIYQQACTAGLEGIISKEINSTYISKRTQSWLKNKCTLSQEFIIIGYTQPQGTRQYFGSLLLGYYDKKNKLQFAGHVGTGFNSKSLASIYTLLQKYKTTHSSLDVVPPSVTVHQWVKPKIIVEVEFTEWTQEGVLRHPSFKGIRMDKPTTPLALTHPEKVMYPENNITKLEIAQYYETIAPWMLPHIINRPLSLLRCPHGWNATCFFQKHLHNKADNIVSLNIDNLEYFYIKDIKGLIELVQMGTLEIHPWGGKIDNIEKPDRMLFDLDPDITIPWEKVIAAAFLLKDELLQYGLQAFVKMTGGKGLHLVIPLQRRYSWETVLHFSKIFAQYMTQKYPHDYIDTMSKAKRHNKIFIDYLRNHRGATAIAPYSTRARENAPVALPLRWDALTSQVTPSQFTVKNLKTWLDAVHNDPWEGFFEIKQSLPSLK